MDTGNYSPRQSVEYRVYNNLECSEWLHPIYFGDKLFRVHTAKANLMMRSNKKNRTKTPRMRKFNFTQDIVGCSGRVSGCLGSFDTTNEDPCSNIAVQ